jgi:hypothetical protein
VGVKTCYNVLLARAKTVSTEDATVRNVAIDPLWRRVVEETAEIWNVRAFEVSASPLLTKVPKEAGILALVRQPPLGVFSTSIASNAPTLLIWTPGAQSLKTSRTAFEPPAFIC